MFKICKFYAKRGYNTTTLETDIFELKHVDWRYQWPEEWFVVFRASRRNCARLLLGPGDRLRLLSKPRIWVENTPPHKKKKTRQKNQNKTSMAKAMRPFRDSRPLLGSPGPGPMSRLNRLSYVLVILIWPDELLLILMPGGVGGINDQMWLVILLTGQVHGWWYLWPGDWLVVLMTGSAACVLVVNINDKRSDPYCGWWY